MLADVLMTSSEMVLGQLYCEMSIANKSQTYSTEVAVAYTVSYGAPNCQFDGSDKSFHLLNHLGIIRRIEAVD